MVIVRLLTLEKQLKRCGFNGYFLIAVLGVVFFIQVLLRYILTYKLSESHLEVILFNFIPFCRIRFTDIIRAEESSPFSPEALDPLMWPSGNRLWGKCVLIVKNKGIRKNILITPDNPKIFLDKLSGKMKHQS